MSLRLAFRLKIPPLPLLHPTEARAILQREVGQATQGLVEEIATHARAHTPVGVSGLLRASIGTRITLATDARHLVSGEVYTGAQVPYARAVEEGRAPGSWPPWGPGTSLALWVQRVVGADVSRTFLFARAIFRRGIRPRHIFRNALAAVRPRIRPTLQAAVDRAVRALGGRG